MDEEDIKALQSDSEQDLCRVVASFNEKNAQSFSFPDMSAAMKKQLVEALTHQLQRGHSAHCYAQCLEMVRILSRDNSGLEVLTTDNVLNCLLRTAGLEQYARQMGEIITVQEITDNQVVVEAQKCLCNLIFNSSAAQRKCCTNGCVEGIMQRLKTYKDPSLIYEIKYFDMRMLFLLTALCSDIRPKLVTELHGLQYLLEVLDLTLREAEENRVSLSDNSVDLCSEVLKILFNITVVVDRGRLDEEAEAHFMRLVSVLRELLLCKTATKEKREELHSHTVNLLVNMPSSCYEELLTPMNDAASSALSREVEYDGRNIEAVNVVLHFLSRRLDRPMRSLKESLTPILHTLCQMCRSHRLIRKYCKRKVLPPLKDDVKRLPEEGNTLRNRLCKLFTSPVTEVKELAADFIFVLCKEKVGRFVKYTGYGNAAGLLANRGLMCGGASSNSTLYSSESEESDTEEYLTLRDHVNPVTGRWEDVKPDPMGGMSEEQKEYEAMKLVDMMDKLAKEGVIQPSIVGEDGRPMPVDHILQLTEGINLNERPEEEDERS